MSSITVTPLNIVVAVVTRACRQAWRSVVRASVDPTDAPPADRQAGRRRF